VCYPNLLNRSPTCVEVHFFRFNLKLFEHKPTKFSPNQVVENVFVILLIAQKIVFAVRSNKLCPGPSDVVKQITSISIEPGVHVEVTIEDDKRGAGGATSAPAPPAPAAAVEEGESGAVEGQ